MKYNIYFKGQTDGFSTFLNESSLRLFLVFPPKNKSIYWNVMYLDGFGGQTKEFTSYFKEIPLLISTTDDFFAPFLVSS